MILPLCQVWKKVPVRMFFVLCLMHLQVAVDSFGILPSSSDGDSHMAITKKAILNTTVLTCRDLAKAERTKFVFPAHPLTAEGVAAACGTSQSTKTFHHAIRSIQWRNVRVDFRHVGNPSFHFDKEMFAEGKKVITEGLVAVKASIKQENYETAREKLGEILHPLQDFYSHSNWVELGNTLPNSNLIIEASSIENIADKSRATCRSCNGDDCRNNILEDILSEKILTTGYTGLNPFTSKKPKGKCSHGGRLDQTSGIEPKGGINKDFLSSSHGHLHTQAANLAMAATSQILEDIRQAAGDRKFLKMVGIPKGSGKALSFVIDTTKSMNEDIAVVKAVTSTINRDKGSAGEPSDFILVPFNDPGYGPMIKTTDSRVFLNRINSLTASGDHDQELSLSGLHLALTSAPFNSEIFLFTDAPAKDKHLKSTLIALIEQTQMVVNFMITDSVVTNRRRRSGNDLRRSRKISPADAQLYRDLAQVSGGQVIEVTKSELPAVTGIITQTATSSMVILLYAVRSSGKAENFHFLVAETEANITVYITGRSVDFTVVSPTGLSQESSNLAGTLITVSQLVGNFRTLQLQQQVGQWEIQMKSNDAFVLKVIGHSSIDFLVDFMESSHGPFDGFDTIETRPRAGLHGTLMISITGSDSATVTEVSLIGFLDTSEIKGTLVPQGTGNVLVQFVEIPSAEFVVRIKGRISDSSGLFQRQSPTCFKGSYLTITAESNRILVPGKPFLVPFSVMTNQTGGNFTIRATNNKGFDFTSPDTLFLETGQDTNGTVTLSAPLNTPSGTDIILTIDAEAPGGTDMNYIMLRFSVVNTVTDFTHPTCQLLSLKSHCSKNCKLEKWEFSAEVTDGAEGTGVGNVTLGAGNGALKTSRAPDNENKMLVSYSASCCAPHMKLRVEDRVGNTGFCLYNVQNVSSAAAVSAMTLCCWSIVTLGFLILSLN